MSSTQRLRYDNRGNVISNGITLPGGNGFDTKSYIEYNEMGNIASTKEVTTTTSNGETSTIETLKEYEYQKLDGTYIVSKITTNGLVTTENHYNALFTATNGDKVYDADFNTYVYADESNQLVNIKSSSVRKYDADCKGFDVITTTVDSNMFNIVENTKVTYGNTNEHCYDKTITWTVENGEKVAASVVESYWIEQEDSKADLKHYKEYYSNFYIDPEYNKIEVEGKESIFDQYHCDVYIRHDIFDRIEEIKGVKVGEDGNTYEIITGFEPFGYDDCIISKTLRIANFDQTISEFKSLRSTGEDIYWKYMENGIRYYHDSEYDSDHKLLRTIDNQLNLENNKQLTVKYDYLYDSNNREIMKTHTVIDDGEESIDHVLTIYDENGNNVYTVTENSLIHRIFDKVGTEYKAAFIITDIEFPMCKSIFDYFYNKIIEQIA